MTIDIIFNVLDKTQKGFAGLNSGLNKVTQTASRLQGCLRKMNQTAELFDKMGAAVTQITTPYREFEQSMADLSAITGTTGADLERLGKIAREVGVTSGLGATGAVDAFKLLASQIDVNTIGLDGLVELQNKTITLAQASGMSLTDAANSMAGTINQFGLQASEAGRVINVLAAGSKYGAAEIPELAQSFKVVGAAANAAGLSVEQTAGAIETLSKNNLKGAEAGTALRNIMLKMQTSLGVDFRKTSFSEALTDLKPKLQDATYLSKLFGMENIAAAQFLIANADMVEQMTAKVTGTATATEQAAISTDTWNHRLKIQTARFNEFFMKVTENSKGILNAIQVTSQLSSVMLSFSPLLSALGTGLKIIGGGFTGIVNVAKAFRMMNAAMNLGKMATYAQLTARYGIAGRIAAVGIWAKTVAVKAFNFATKTALPAFLGLIAQTWAWTAALLANPVSWIVLGIAALVAAVVVCWNKFAEFRAGVMTVWDVVKGFGTAIFENLVAPFKVAIELIQMTTKALTALFSGDFKGAWEAIKEGVSNSVDTIIKPYQTIYDTATQIPDNYNKHLTAERAKDSEKKDVKNPTEETTPNPDSFNPFGSLIPKTPKYDYSTLNTVSGDATQTDTTINTNSSNIGTRLEATDKITIDYKPTVNISAEMTQKSKDDLMSVLRSHASELAKLVKDEMRKNERGVYGLS